MLDDGEGVHAITGERERESFLLYIEKIFLLVCVRWYSGRAYDSVCQGLGFKIETFVFFTNFMLLLQLP